METLIEYKKVSVWQDETLVLHDVDLCVGKGEFVYLTGKVGAGKSSLIKTIYGELPVNGNKQQRRDPGADTTATVLGYDMMTLRVKDIPALRRKMGVIFQDFQLLSDRTVTENLDFVLRATGWKKKDEINARITDVLTLVDMVDKAGKMPNELSGGEKQRIAIARAILNSPQLIIADEPTGNLDPETSRSITELLHSISRSGSSVIMITHNLSLLEEYPARVLHCKDGGLVDITGDKAEMQKDCENEEEEWKEIINEKG